MVKHRYTSTPLEAIDKMVFGLNLNWPLPFDRCRRYAWWWHSFFNICKEAQPSAIKLIFKKPSTYLLTINRETIEKVDINNINTIKA